jgi:hypothetical protein
MGPEEALNALNTANATETGDPATTPAATAPTFQEPPQVTPTEPVASQTSTGHPAWQEILSQVPEMLHDNLRPTLEKWDKGVQEKLTQVHSQYAPYKEFLESKPDPEQLRNAQQMYNLLNTDPVTFYSQMGEWLQSQGALGEQGQQPQQQTGEVDLGEFGDQQVDISKDPRFQQLEQQQQMIAQQLEHAQQMEMQRQADTWLDMKQSQITASLKEKYGLDMNPNSNPQAAKAWDYIIHSAAAIGERTKDFDGALDAAVGQYVELISGIRNTPTPNNGAPPVIPPSNGTPSTASPGTKGMTEEQRKAYGVSLLTSALRES